MWRWRGPFSPLFIRSAIVPLLKTNDGKMFALRKEQKKKRELPRGQKEKHTLNTHTHRSPTYFPDIVCLSILTHLFPLCILTQGKSHSYWIATPNGGRISSDGSSRRSWREHSRPNNLQIHLIIRMNFHGTLKASHDMIAIISSFSFSSSRIVTHLRIFIHQKRPRKQQRPADHNPSPSSYKYRSSA